jgi:predicted TIM-barrel fold metal-dependent hydrolase
MSGHVIDAHTHAFPPDCLADRAGYLARDFWFSRLYENPKSKLTTERELLESMATAGVQRSLVCGFPWRDPGLCREHNAWLAEVCKQHPGRLDFLAIVKPDDPDAARDAADALAAGAVGIGELNADAQNFDLEAPGAHLDLMETCKAHRAPVMLHTSEPLGHAYPGKGTATPAKLVTWLNAFNDQPVVLAHWGGGLAFYELMPEVHQVTRNVVYDSAATTYLYRPEVFERMAELVGHDRVLFASDFPVLGQRRLLAQVTERLGNEPWFATLMAGNAERVYRLTGGLA